MKKILRIIATVAVAVAFPVLIIPLIALYGLCCLHCFLWGKFP